MAIVTCGINHQSAPIAIREQFAIVAEQTPMALKELLKHRAVNEAVIISTCNRTEVVGVVDDSHAVKRWMADKPGNAQLDITPFYYHYEDLAAVRHLMRVACGLDSMVLGESQIFGQLKRAYALACQQGAVGCQLRQLFPAIFSTGKKIRQYTAIGDHPVSMAYATIQLAKRIFSHLAEQNILLIGAGETIELMATHLQTQGCNKLTIASRKLVNAQKLAKLYGAAAISLDNITEQLASCDMIISATASQHPIIDKQILQNANRLARRRPIFIADLAMPRDIASDIEQLSDVYLYNLDDLQQVIQANLKNRREAARQAHSMIETQALHYMQQLRILDAGEVISDYRQRMEIVRDDVLQNALNKLQQGADPQIVTTELARLLMNKMMHQPTLKIRQAAAHNDVEQLLLIKQLFDVPSEIT